MKKLSAKSIPYGISDFRRIRNEAFYYVDKTAYLSAMEMAGNFLIFVRPRRFGKSLFVDMLKCYYDLNLKDDFEKYFGDLAIARDPTENRGKYMVLGLDFSKVDGCEGKSLEDKFECYVNGRLDDFIHYYRDIFKDEPNVSSLRGVPGAGSKFDRIVAQLRRYAADPLVPELAKGTTLHSILYQFKGKQIHRLEELA